MFRSYLHSYNETLKHVASVKVIPEIRFFWENKQENWDECKQSSSKVPKLQSHNTADNFDQNRETPACPKYPKINTFSASYSHLVNTTW